MDSTNENTADLFPAYLSNCSYLVARPEGETLRRSPVIPPETNALVITTQAKVDADNAIVAASDLEFTGVQDSAYRNFLAVRSAADRRLAVVRLLARAQPRAELTSCRIEPEELRDTSRPLKLHLEYRIPEVLQTGGTVQLLELPELGGKFGLLHDGELELAHRRHTLKLDFTCQVKEDFTLTLPARFRLEGLPEAMQQDIPQLAKFRRTLSRRGNQLHGQSLAEFSAVEIPAAAYGQVRAGAARWRSALLGRPLVSERPGRVDLAQLRKEYPDDSSVLLGHDTDVVLESSGDYVTVDRGSRIVLDYAGVKKFSEIRCGFLPGWEEVSVNAVLTLPNGEPRTIGPEHVRIMDAPWRVAAPRYPAGKVLVTVLPGVVPGTRIDFTVRRSCHGHPGYANVFQFQGTEPQGPRKVTLTLSKRQKLRISPEPAGVRHHEEELPGELVRHVWQSDGAAAVPDEPDAPPEAFHLPSVAVSTLDYAVVGKLRTALQEAVSRDDREFNAAARKLAEENYDNENERIRKIRDFVSRRVKAAGPEFDQLPWTAFSAPGTTLKAGYGTSADRAILLAALLDYCEIPCRFVLVSALAMTPESGRLATLYPQWSFKRVLVYLPKQDLYLNDTDEYDVPGATASEGLLGLSLGDVENEPAWITVLPQVRYQNQRQTVCRIVGTRDNAAEVTITTSYFGTSCGEQIRRFARYTPETRRQAAEKLAAAVSGSAEVLGYDGDFSAYPGKVTLRLRVPGLFRRSGDRLELQLPGFDGFPRMLGGDLPCRRTPKWRNAGTNWRIRYEIVPPPEFVPENLRSRPARLGVSGAADYAEHSDYLNDRMLELRCRLTTLPGMSTPEDYLELRAMHRQLSGMNARRVLFKKTSDRKGGR